MKYRIATSTLAACLISLGAAMGVQAQEHHRYDDDVQESVVQQYAQVHHLSKKQMKDLEHRLREDQLTREERRELIAIQRGDYRGNAYGNNGGYGYNNANEYRYRMGNSVRVTNYAGAQLLQRAVDEGYRQGWESGQLAVRAGRGFSPTHERVWRDGTVGYSNLIPRDDYRNFFREGFTRGYQDGYYNQNRYGTYSNGRASILGNILGSILGFTIR
jgi:hypothetical protein